MELIWGHSCKIECLCVLFHSLFSPLYLPLLSSGFSSLHEYSCPKLSTHGGRGIFHLPFSFRFENKKTFLTASEVFVLLSPMNVVG